ncbi:hypothetical protein LINPERHAP2_LOCUS19526, partial [Linum perenne]
PTNSTYQFHITILQHNHIIDPHYTYHPHHHSMYQFHVPIPFNQFHITIPLDNSIQPIPRTNSISQSYNTITL